MSIRVSDFILQTRGDLQEKSTHWSDEDLLVKLKRAYIAFQEDLPFFVTDVVLGIQKGKREYFLTFKPLKDISLKIYNTKFVFTDMENLYIKDKNNLYSFLNNALVLKDEPNEDSEAKFVYRNLQEVETEKCFIELPSSYLKALRYMFLMEIHDKPTRNTKERNLSSYYEKKYQGELYNLKVRNKIRVKNITSKYQRV